LSKPKPYLLGKYLIATDPETSEMSLFRFKEKIGKDLWVIQPCCPAHGEELPVGAIIINTYDLSSHPCDPRPVAMIFDDMKSFQTVLDDVEGDEQEQETADPTVKKQPPALLN
jgi:hypothetical protein